MDAAIPSVQPFKDNPRSERMFVLVLGWIIACVILWQIYWYLQVRAEWIYTPGATPFETLCFFGIVIFGLTFGVVILQVHFEERVYPLVYLTPIVDMLVFQVMIQFGSILGSACFVLFIFMIVVNCLILALAWDELANRSVSGIPGLWMSIMPSACFAILASAGLCRMYLDLQLNGTAPLEWVLWPILWNVLMALLLLLFALIERRRTLPPEKWMLPTALLIWTVLTFVLGPFFIILSGLNLSVILAVLTSALLQFGVASANFEAIMHHAEGRIALGLAMISGYVGALFCVVLAWFVILPFRAPVLP